MITPERLSEPIDFQWMVERILDEGFGVHLKPSRDDFSSFITVTTKDDERPRQVTRLVIHDFTPSEFAHIYWDIMSTIHRLERR